MSRKRKRGGGRKGMDDLKKIKRREAVARHRAKNRESLNEKAKNYASKLRKEHPDKIKERSKRYYKKNRDAIIQRQMKYNAANKESINEKVKKYAQARYRNNKEEIDTRNREWAKKNIDWIREYGRKESAKFRKCNPEKIKALNKRDAALRIEGLSDVYIRQILRDKGLANPPHQLIEIQRMTIKLKRELKNQKHA